MRQQTQVTCPNCRTPFQAEVEQIVDVSQDPTSKSRLLAGQLNLIQCPSCGFQGQLNLPVVYHDPEKELLLTYAPADLNVNKDEQERIIGRLIQRIVDKLDAEQRKGYLLQPQAVLTMQGLAECILEGDGITREELDNQRAKMQLFEELLRTPEDQLDTFIQDHDADIDSAFMQLASLTIQVTAEPEAQQALATRLEKVIEQSTYGKQLVAEREEVQKATQSLQDLGEGITREAILDLVIEAPNERRVAALVTLVRPAFDYTFFQLLSDKIDTSEGDAQEKLSTLRAQILEITEEIDRREQARLQQISTVIENLIEAEDLDEELSRVTPMIDDYFLNVLRTMLQAASEQKDEERFKQLMRVEQRIAQLIKQSLPRGLQLAQDLLALQEMDDVEAFLQEHAAELDQDLFNGLLSASQQYAETGRNEESERLQAVYQLALKTSMKAKMT